MGHKAAGTAAEEAATRQGEEQCTGSGPRVHFRMSEAVRVVGRGPAAAVVVRMQAGPETVVVAAAVGPGESKEPGEGDRRPAAGTGSGAVGKEPADMPERG